MFGLPLLIFRFAKYNLNSLTSGGVALRYITVKGRSILIFSLLIIAAAVVSAAFSDGAETASAKAERIIPIYCVDTEEKKVAITFDAAWGADDTSEIISILDEYNAKATFFVVGDWARKYPDSVKAFSAAGHEIANHSNDHTLYSKLSSEQIKEDILLCNEAIELAAGKAPTLLRAPSGDYTDTSERAAKEMNMTTVQWSVDSLDWQGLEVSEIVSRVVGAADCGDIILFHNDVKNTPPALREVLRQLSEKGYSFVTVSELIYHDSYRIDATGKQISEVKTGN